jgi:N-acetylglucosamine-6-sulfatase
MASRKLFIVLCIVLVITAFSCVKSKKSNLLVRRLNKSKPRNVIFILSDDHRYDFMGFTGKIPWLETPNMDLLAKDGIYCQNTFVSTSLSSPSRASILTGLYAHSHMVVDNSAPEPEDLIYFPEYIRASGYQTAFFGKWHMGSESDDPRRGFDHWESFKGQGDYYNPALNINGKRITYGDSAYITDLLTDHVIEWLNDRKSDKPFFLYLSHKAVHAEFSPAKRHRGKYTGKKIEYPPSFDITKPEKLTDDDSSYYKLKNEQNPEYSYGKGRIPDWVKEQRFSWHGVDYMYNGEMDFESFYYKYCETLSAVDESLGTIINYLKERGIYKSTLIIYMGDNGFSFGEHGLIDKRHFYEESAKVPLLVSCPDLFKGGRVENRMIQNIDIAPSILEIFGIRKPGHMQGMSFIQMLKGKDIKWRDKIFYEYYWEENFPQTPTTFGIRTDRYKYIRYWGIWDTNEFYDLENDPYEMNNLIASPEYQHIIKNMADELYTWLENTNGMKIPLKRPLGPRFRGDYRNINLY